MIVGNKCDLDGERCVESSIASSRIGELGLTYLEVSAKTGHNIKEFFRELAFTIAGGKKLKEDPSKAQAQTTTTQPPKPAATTGNVTLTGSAGKNAN